MKLTSDCRTFGTISMSTEIITIQIHKWCGCITSEIKNTRLGREKKKKTHHKHLYIYTIKHVLS